MTRQEAIKLNSKIYFTGKPCNRGHISERFVSTRRCKTCTLEDTIKWREINPELSKSSKVKSDKKFYQKNTIRIKSQTAQWKKENKGKVNSYKAKRRAKLLQAAAIADWIKIQEIYENCPEGYQVDHIEPLQGSKICGLHVSWNLQYLTASENASKRNQDSLLSLDFQVPLEAK